MSNAPKGGGGGFIALLLLILVLAIMAYANSKPS